jgi:Ca-activated chloride channel homolog
MKYKIVSISLVLVMSLAACDRAERDPNAIPSNAAVVNVVANTSLTGWLNKVATQFNSSKAKTADGRQAFVKIDYAEAGEAVGKMTAPDDTALWIPDNEVWADVLAAKGNAAFKGDCVSVAQSPLVIAMWRPLAESLGWPTRKLGWLDVSSLAADEAAWRYYSGGQYGKTLRLAHAHPGLSGSGASALLAVMQAAKQSAAPLTEAEIKDPIVQASLAAFEGSVAVFGASPDALGQTMRKRGIQYLGAAAMYESNVLQYGAGDPLIVPIYPFEGTIMATHPACISNAASAEEQAAAKLFREFLLKEDAQAAAVANGLRSVNANLTQKLSANESNGSVDIAQPKILYAAPSAQTLLALQSSWQTARKPLNLVMVLDTSGSMKGGKIESMKQAAQQFVGQLNDNDFLTLIAFNGSPTVLLEHELVSRTRETAIANIEGLTAKGGTAMFDAIRDAADVIARNNSPRQSNIMVVLSDGLDTNSVRYKFGEPLTTLAAGNNTSLYTIAYGGDADKNVLGSLATQSNGNFYVGSEANIAGIYEEMSTAFGGNVGIGR